MSKRTKERARAARLAPREDLPVNKSRLLQLFVNTEFRGGFKPFKDHVFGPEVEARTPEELVERTDEAYVAAAIGKIPN
jgi:hypothetical protein